MNPSRRSFFLNAGLLTLGVGGAWLARDRLFMPRASVDARGPASSGWLPFTADQALPIVPVSLGGQLVNALIDSGAQYSVIDAGLAAGLKLAGTPVPVVAMGVGGSPQVSRGVRLDLAIGALSLAGLGAAVIDLSHVDALGAGGFSLVLGDNVLSSLIADIDFPRRRLSLHRRDGFQLAADAIPTSVRRGDRRLIAPIELEGTPLDAVLDTGASAVLVLSADQAKKSGLLQGRPILTGRSVSLSGVTPGRSVVVESVRFAGETYRDVPVQIFDGGPGPGLPAGLLGVGGLARFRLVLDQGAGRVHVTQSEPSRSRRT